MPYGVIEYSPTKIEGGGKRDAWLGDRLTRFVAKNGAAPDLLADLDILKFKPGPNTTPAALDVAAVLSKEGWMGELAKIHVNEAGQPVIRFYGQDRSAHPSENSHALERTPHSSASDTSWSPQLFQGPRHLPDRPSDECASQNQHEYSAQSSGL